MKYACVTDGCPGKGVVHEFDRETTVYCGNCFRESPKVKPRRSAK